MASCGFDERSVTTPVRCCPRFTRRLRTSGPKERFRRSDAARRSSPAARRYAVAELAALDYAIPLVRESADANAVLHALREPDEPVPAEPSPVKVTEEGARILDALTA